jgi:NADH dehydrogenase FAD-containing subunit
VSLSPPARPSLAARIVLTGGSSVDVLVIGAGPTGLGAAKRLNQIVRPPIRETARGCVLNNGRMAPHG